VRTKLAWTFETLVATSALVFFVSLSSAGGGTNLDRRAEERRQRLFVIRSVVHRRERDQGGERAADGHGDRSGRRERECVAGRRKTVDKLVLRLEGSEAEQIEGRSG